MISSDIVDVEFLDAAARRLLFLCLLLRTSQLAPALRAGVFARLPYSPRALRHGQLPDEETHAPPLDRSLPAEGA